ncbi:unnamed protein product [Rangifer tarandus platyrhynchus]|uniref:Uncharacterized protein n=1 Tax=Rangifer tarandus platyrhynchus TaxID=3082113 RepID=A0ABN8ZGZ7_RANTA|nr:unnamed protein product [Rangifer tarandus platyrhynchus]
MHLKKKVVVSCAEKRQANEVTTGFHKFKVIDDLEQRQSYGVQRDETSFPQQKEKLKQTSAKAQDIRRHASLNFGFRGRRMQIRGTEPRDRWAFSAGMIWQATLASSPPYPVKKKKKTSIVSEEGYLIVQIKCYSPCPRNRNSSGSQPLLLGICGPDTSQEGPELGDSAENGLLLAYSPPTPQARRGRPL